MLVLSRFRDESVIVKVPGELMKSGEDLVMEVMMVDVVHQAFGRKKGKIGFNAPKEVLILRSEVEEKS